MSTAAWLPRALALILCAISATAYTWPAWSNFHAGWFSDSVDYVYLAEYYAHALRGEVLNDVTGYFRVTRFPPAFPLVLALLGVGASVEGAALWVSAITLLLALGLTALWYVRELRSTGQALILVLPLVALPGLFLLVLYLVSEPQMMLLIIGALLAAGSDGDKLSGSRLLVIGLLIGAATVTRTAAIAFVPALVVFVTTQSARVGWKVAAVAAASAPPVLWAIYRNTLPRAESYVDPLLTGELVAEYGGWLGYLAGQPERIFRGYVALFDPGEGITAIVAGALLAVSCLIGLGVALRRRTLASWGLLGYWGIVFVWPYPAEMARLLAITLPIVLLLAVRGMQYVLRQLAGERFIGKSAALVGVPLLVASVPVALGYVNRALMPLPQAELEPMKRNESFFMMPDANDVKLVPEVNWRIILAMRALADAVPAGECVYTITPTLSWFHARTLYFRRLPMPVAGETRQALLSRLHECRFVLVMHFTTRQYGQQALYPWPELGDAAVPIFVSAFDRNGQRLPAAALLEIRADARQ